MKQKLFFYKRQFCLLFLSGLLLSFSGVVSADDISVSASVARKTVELGDSLQLTITVSNYQDVPPLELPKIDGFDSRYLGPATHVSIVNGHYTSTTSLIYRLYPLKTGKFKIPTVTMNLGGKDYSTEPIDVEVVEAGKVPKPSAGGSSDPSAVSLQDKIFVVMGLPKDQFYLGEPVPITIKLFVNNISVRNMQFPEFEHTGLTVDDFQQPQKSIQAIGGIEYQVVEFKTLAYPTRTGELTLGPTKLSCNIVFKSAADRRPSYGGVFDDDFFDSFFNNFDLKTVTLESTDLKIKILPLPEEGKPQGFSGAVGTFDFSMAIGPADIKVGDPVTVRMKVSGQGNLKSFAMPAIPDSSNFKFYDPQVTDKPGEKSLEQVVIPKNDRVKEVPAVTFSYFDPQKQQYQTIGRGPFPLTVKPLEKGEEAKVVGLSPALSTVEPKSETLGRDIIFIKEFPGILTPVGFILLHSVLYWVGIVILFGLWIGGYSYYRFSHRMKTDLRFAQKLQAPKQARSGLGQAKLYIEKGEQKQFYDTLFRTLQNYFAFKFHLNSGSVDLETVMKSMRAKGFATPIVGTTREIFAECEMVRYASIGTDSEKMRNSFKKAEEIIDYCERNWR